MNSIWKDIESRDLSICKIVGYKVTDNEIMPYSSPPQGRGDCAVTYVIQGGYHYKNDDNTEFDCLSGDMSFLPFKSKYSHVNISVPSQMYVFYFKLTDEKMQDYDFCGMQATKIDGNPMVFEKLFRDAYDTFFGVIPAAAKLKSLLYRILGEISSQLLSNTFEREQIKRLQPAIDMLMTDDLAGITVYSMAERCFMSEYYFREQFKKYVGVSPKAYIIEKRIEKVEQMIKNYNITITAAALACGFNDPSYFFRLYHKIRGKTPGS